MHRLGDLGSHVPGLEEGCWDGQKNRPLQGGGQ